MAERIGRPNNSTTTVGAIVAEERGVNLLCRCGHKTSLLPAQICALAKPETRLSDFKRRFRCSMCGRLGSSAEIELKTFAVPESLSNRSSTRAPRTKH